MGQFEEQMSTVIIEEHLGEIKDRYSEIKNAMSRSGSWTVITGLKALTAAGVQHPRDYENQGYSCRLNSSQFLPVPEIIKKLGLESKMQEILESKSSRLKGSSSIRKPLADASHTVNGSERGARGWETSPKPKPQTYQANRSDMQMSRQPSDYYRSILPDQLVHFELSGNQDDSDALGNEASKSGWVNLAHMVFESGDQFFVHEDRELLYEIDQNARRMIFRRSSEGNSTDLIDEEEDENYKEIVGKLNKEYLEQGDTTSQEDPYELGLSDSDEGIAPLPGELTSPWLFENVEDRSILESATGTKFNTSLYDERSSTLRILQVSPVPANVTVPQAPVSKKKKVKPGFHEEVPNNFGQVTFTLNDLLYKVDPELLARLKKSKKAAQTPISQPTASQTQSILEPAPEPQEAAPQAPKVNPSLLINHIDPTLLEKEENHARSSSEELSISPNKNGGASKPTASKVESEDPSKAAKTGKKGKKNKKTTNTLVLVDDEMDDKPSGLLGSLIPSKKQSKKAKQAAKQQKLAAEQAKQQKEELNLDEVSEIQHERSEDVEMLAESLDNPIADDHESSTLLRSTRELELGPRDFRAQEALLLDDDKHRLAKPEIENSEPRDSSEGMDKKKKKKKPKKGAQTVTKTLPNGKVDPLFEELSQPDKEKDSAITQVDMILRRAGPENIASLILQVLDNDFMAEEIFVDKRRYYTKYVYVADAVASVPGNEKGLVLPNK